MSDLPSMQITKADPSHLQDVIDLISSCRLDLDRSGIHQWNDQYPDPACVARDLAAGDLYAAILDGELVGAVALNQDQEPEYSRIAWSHPAPALVIHRLCVSPSHQGRGIGSALMRFAELRARDARCSSIRLDVYSGNPGAVDLYKHLGYAMAGQIEFPNRSLPFHCMEKAISSLAEPPLPIEPPGARSQPRRESPIPVSIRPAGPDDARNLAALAIQVWLHTYATTGIRATLSEYVLDEYTDRRFRERCADPGHMLLLAEMDGHLVGFADLDFDSPRNDVPGTRTELATLYVQEHFLGRGIGSALLAACQEEARWRTGHPEVWLSVYHRNARALLFYQKHGFRRVGSFDFEFGGERHENHVLVSTEA